MLYQEITKYKIIFIPYSNEIQNINTFVKGKLF